jgi:Fic family protein
MPWNWQRPEWPRFRYDASALAARERRFLVQSGEFAGAMAHVGAADRDALRIELIGEEALKTSAIEGEILDRASVQSSLREQFGLGGGRRRVPAAERGMTEMLADLYRRFAAPLAHETLFAWHRMVMAGTRGIADVGRYRRHAEPMRIVSGDVARPRIHFEAPPSRAVAEEMTRFVAWFNDTAPAGRASLPALERAGIAHLYFVSIHPFEDGNGRIGRALAEKSLAETVGRPTLIALAYTIERDRRAYYDALERASRGVDISDWLAYFADTVLDAQRNTMRRVAFHVAKARFYDRLAVRLNARQEKAIQRLFRAGIEGFKGGLSAEKYMAITKASRATATRDLAGLVALGALTRTGERRYARYALKLDG